MVVQFWYPSNKCEGEVVNYLQEHSVAEMMIKNNYFDLNADKINSWRHLKTYSRKDAPLSRAGKFRLLLFSPGDGISKTNYTVLAEELASWGYVIGVVDHIEAGFVLDEHRTGPQKQNSDVFKTTVNWRLDLSAVADSVEGSSNTFLSNKIIPDQMIALGHSLGGAAALDLCSTDHRFLLCINMDGAPFGELKSLGLKKPILVLKSSPDYSDADLNALKRTRKEWESMHSQIIGIWSNIFSKNSKIPAYLISIHGTGHVSFSDAPFLFEEVILKYGGKIISAERTLHVITTVIRAFISSYLDTSSTQFTSTIDALNEVEVLIKQNN